MRKCILIVLFVFFCLTFFLAFIGIILSWWNPNLPKLPYLGLFIKLTMVEAAAVVAGIAKGEIKLRPAETGRVFICKKQEKINNFLKKFIERGSRVDIFSGRLSWVAKDPAMKEFLIEKAKTDEINIFLPEMNEVAEELKKNSVNVYEYKDIRYIPSAKFTLLNRGRHGGEVLAISSGALPRHRIVEHEAIISPMLTTAASDLVAMVESLVKKKSGN